MSTSVGSFTVVGLTAKAVRVEADVTRGLPRFTVIGMRDRRVTQIRERVRAALVASGCEFPSGRVVVNVAPAGLRRAGAGLELAIAAAVLAASDQLDRRALEGVAVVGGLGLDGRVLPVEGTQAIADAAWAAGVRTLVLPAAGKPLRPPAEPVRILHAETLADLAAVGRSRPAPSGAPGLPWRARLAMALAGEADSPGPDVSVTGVDATFEVALGPDLSLVLDCHSAHGEYCGEDEFRKERRQLLSVSFEIRRVLCRQGADDPSEVELTGEDREAAEALARRVIPEVGDE